MKFGAKKQRSLLFSATVGLVLFRTLKTRLHENLGLPWQYSPSMFTYYRTSGVKRSKNSGRVTENGPVDISVLDTHLAATLAVAMASANL